MAQLATVASLAFVATAGAVTPSPQSPAPGSSFEAENPPSFTATDSPPPGSGVYLSISSSPSVDTNGSLGDDAGFAQMNPVGGIGSTAFTWAPVNVGNAYPWAPGTYYYWQVSHIDCFAVSTCDVNGPVWQFTITPVPTPQPVSPADNSTVAPGSLVQFAVYSAIDGDIGIYIQLQTASGTMSFAPYGISGHMSYFRV